MFRHVLLLIHQKPCINMSPVEERDVWLLKSSDRWTLVTVQAPASPITRGTRLSIMIFNVFLCHPITELGTKKYM